MARRFAAPLLLLSVLLPLLQRVKLDLGLEHAVPPFVVFWLMSRQWHLFRETHWGKQVVLPLLYFLLAALTYWFLVFRVGVAEHLYTNLLVYLSLARPIKSMVAHMLILTVVAVDVVVAATSPLWDANQTAYALAVLLFFTVVETRNLVPPMLACLRDPIEVRPVNRTAFLLAQLCLLLFFYYDQALGFLAYAYCIWQYQCSEGLSQAFRPPLIK